MGTGAEPPLWKSEALVSEAVGRLMSLWGFKRNMGRLWAVLYLSDQPLTSQDLRERLDLSAGAVSMTLAELGEWGVTHKTHVEGDRRDFYVAEGNLWKMIAGVFDRRERAMILETIDVLGEALEFAKTRAEHGTEVDRARATLQVQRITQLLELAQLGKQLLEHLLERARVDVSPLLRVLLGKPL
jgi:DNA-binding transcriptional regulator GbsR (MarR family)